MLGEGAAFGPHDPDSTSEWAHVVWTAWQLITQAGRNPLADIEAMARDRAGRRRDQRVGIGDGNVRIVRVQSRHRPTDDAAGQDAAASDGRRAPQWSCRWPVRPYRRNHCLKPAEHPDGCEHQEQIVAAHIRGPGDKPLRTNEVVNVWDRPPASNDGGS